MKPGSKSFLLHSHHFHSQWSQPPRGNGSDHSAIKMLVGGRKATSRGHQQNFATLVFFVSWHKDAYLEVFQGGSVKGTSGKMLSKFLPALGQPGNSHSVLDLSSPGAKTDCVFQ